MNIGYDLDGIIVKESFYQDFLFKHLPSVALFLRDRAGVQGYPLAQGMIVTGRPLIDKKRTDTWLKYHGISLPVQYSEERSELPHIFKAHCIAQFGLKVFVESDEYQIRFLRHHTKAEIMNLETAIKNNLIAKP